MKKLTKTLLATTLLTLSFSSIAETDTTLEKANQGDADAQYLMGLSACYNSDYYAALAWYEKAAKQSLRNPGISSEYKLAQMYYDGKCSNATHQQAEPNYPKALEWFERVQYRSELLKEKYRAKLVIADIYERGLGGVTKDVNQAKIIYTEIANLPDDKLDDKGLLMETRGNARMRLAFLYYEGKYAPQDYALANQWATAASSDGNPSAAILLGGLRYKGLGTKQDKASGTALMKKVCDMESREIACKLYNRMKANLPIDF